MANDAALSTQEQNAPGAGQYEREILFKFLYEMRQDLSDMKNLITELVRTNNLRMPTNIPKTTLPQLGTPPSATPPSSTPRIVDDYSLIMNHGRGIQLQLVFNQYIYHH